MGISVSTSKQQVTASVNDETVSATVSAGFGASGAAGSAATITVGTITTGAPGSSASVTNVGSSSAAVLNFTIPAGATGATGSAGPTGPAGSYNQSLNTTDTVVFNQVTAGTVISTSSVTTPGITLQSGTGFTGTITFGDSTQQTTAWTGSVGAAHVTGLAAVATSGAYSDLSGTPSAYSLPTASGSVLGGVKVGAGLGINGAASLSVTYGTTSGTAAEGNDSRLSDSRTPTGAAGGDLTGTYPNPTIAPGSVTEAHLANAVRNQLIHPFLLAGM